GKNLEYVKKLKQTPLQVNPYVKSGESGLNGHSDNVIALSSEGTPSVITALGFSWRLLHTIIFTAFLIAALAGAPGARAADSDWFNAEPLFDHSPLTPDPGTRTELSGPLFYSEQKESHHTWAIPPLMAHLIDPVTDYEEFDLGYPILTFDRFGKEFRWQF